jgi:2-keto-4-pentenoate hydratase/2-oxohepta-3-ene-1,7-dioic acid hydratase in catechol pathway
MKLATFRICGSTTWGIIEDEEAIDVGCVLRDRFCDLKSAVAAGALPSLDAHATTARRYPLSAIEWLPVIPNPDKILCIGLNYDTHRKETGRAEVEQREYDQAHRGVLRQAPSVHHAAGA